MSMDDQSSEQPAQGQAGNQSEANASGIQHLSKEQLHTAIRALQKRLRQEHPREANPRNPLLDQLEAEERRRQIEQGQAREYDSLMLDEAAISRLPPAEIRRLSDSQLDAAIKKLGEEAGRTAASRALARLYFERGRRLPTWAQVDRYGVRQESVQRKLSTGAGCLIYSALGLLTAILFWVWVFLVILVFNPNTPQTLWPAIGALILGGGGIIGSYLWFPPLFFAVKRAYLQRFGAEALAEITGIHRELPLTSAHLSWVQLDWRWQTSDGQIWQDNSVHVIQDKRTWQKYEQFITTYAIGKQFPVYFLPEHPHSFVVPAIKRRARPFVTDLFMRGTPPAR